MVEDTPDDLVHELFTQHFWEGHPLGRPILGAGNGGVLHRRHPARLFRGAYVAPNIVISAAGNLEHAGVRDLVDGRSPSCRPPGALRGGPAARQPAGHHPVEGARAEPRVPRDQQLSAEPRRPLRQLHHEHHARRIDELAAVPERPREARPGLRGVQRAERVSRRREHHDLRRLRQRSGGRGRRPVRRGAARDEAGAGGRRRAARGPRIISRAA